MGLFLLQKRGGVKVDLLRSTKRGGGPLGLSPRSATTWPCLHSMQDFQIVGERDRWNNQEEREKMVPGCRHFKAILFRCGLGNTL